MIRRALVWAAVTFLAGCNILGPAAYLTMGQPKTGAQYELVDRPTIVFVDDRMNAIPVNSSRVRRMIADKVTMDLMNEEILTQTIKPRDAMALARNSDREGSLLSIEALGDRVGAEQVIYVEMMSFRGSPDGVTPRAIGLCRVKVIDTANRSRLFPPPESERGWIEVRAISQPFSPELFKTTEGRSQIQELLANLLGDRIAKLFYEHIPDELGTRLEPQ